MGSWEEHNKWCEHEGNRLTGVSLYSMKQGMSLYCVSPIPLSSSILYVFLPFLRSREVKVSRAGEENSY